VHLGSWHWEVFTAAAVIALCSASQLLVLRNMRGGGGAGDVGKGHGHGVGGGGGVGGALGGLVGSLGGGGGGHGGGGHGGGGHGGGGQVIGGIGGMSDGGDGGGGGGGGGYVHYKMSREFILPMTAGNAANILGAVLDFLQYTAGLYKLNPVRPID
jgi:hypothetical protein